MATRRLTCSGLFTSRDQADAVIEELRRLGVTRDDLIVALPKGHAFQPPSAEHGGGAKRAVDSLKIDDQQEAQEEGGAGLSWLLLAGGASVVNPLLSPLIVPGALAAGIVGKVADAVIPEDDQSVGVVMRTHGMSEEEAAYHEDRVNDGAYLILVENCQRWGADTVREIMLRHGAEDRSGHPVQDPAQASQETAQRTG
ncbi:MAG TPA: hypothetical protein VHL09_04665 [Dehalococcoidia bacterium]|nr:hypothetical protein [Dehalococcoidia bacterium]